MKSKILTLLLAIASLTVANAQQRMVRVINGVSVDTVEVWKIDQIYFIPEDRVVLKDTAQAVDLGLSVRWASFNLGASKAEEFGRLVGWGDTTMTNQSKKLQYFPIEKTETDIANSQYDVARHKWGAAWRMPTIDELKELKENCTWTWNSEKFGYVITREGFDDQLFLPATGYREGENTVSETSNGYYWSGSISTDNNKNAQLLSFSDNNTITFSDNFRYMGYAIRPVTGPVKAPLKVASTTTSSVGNTEAKVTATLTGDLDVVKLIGVSFGTSKSALTHGDSNDDSHQVTNEVAEMVTFSFTNLTMNTTYYARVYVKDADGNYKDGEIVEFKTKTKFPVPEYVDLGLPSGVRWAKWNMGSSSELDVPNTVYARYGWGDPTGEIHTTGNDYRVSEYPIFSYQTDKAKDISGSEYDIATVQWGDKWRLPTPADFMELDEMKGYTTWEYGNWADSEGNGYPAWKVTSVKYPDRYIFFPAAGLIRTNGSSDKVRDYANYWVSTDNGYGSANYAQLIRNATIMPTPYGTQIPIRPVYGKPGEFSDKPNVDPNEDPNVDPNEDPNVDPTPETAEVGKAVDLGLPSGTLWADRNIGAVSEADYGDYIAWGDTIARSSYKIVDYIYRDATGQNGYKYLGTDSTHTATYSIGGTIYDAAHVRWGGNWRMPTRAQINELRNKCDWNWEGNGYSINKRGSGTMKEPYNPIAANNFVQSLGNTVSENDIYVAGIISSIDSYYDSAEGIANYKISVDGKPKNEFVVYGNYYMNRQPWKVGNPQIEKGDTVVVCGRVAQNGGNIGFVQQKNWLVSVGDVNSIINIFLPAAGFKIDTEEDPLYIEEKGYYWTDELDNSLEEHFNKNVRTLSFKSDENKVSYDPRYKGLPIRPVQK